MSSDDIEEAERQLPLLFPQLQNFQVTSPEDSTYNCLAWAAGDPRHWWDHLNFWPAGIPREWSLKAYSAVYQLLGYEPCDSAALEAGFVKLAIFVDRAGLPLTSPVNLPMGCGPASSARCGTSNILWRKLGASGRMHTAAWRQF